MFGGGQYTGAGGAGAGQHHHQQQPPPLPQHQQTMQSMQSMQPHQQQQMQMQMQMHGMLGGHMQAPPPGPYGGGQGSTMQPFATGQQPVSTSGLLQQQLAQQAAAIAAQNAGYPGQQPAPAPSFRQNPYAGQPTEQYPSAYPTGYPQQSFSPQTRPPSAAPTPNAFMTAAAPSPRQPQQSQPPPPPPHQQQQQHHPPQQQQQQQQQPQQAPTPSAMNSSTQSMSQQELQEALRGVSLQGMTQQRFRLLAPHQQAALRELMTRQRAQQQTQLGHGVPAAPPQGTPSRGATQPPPPQPMMNGTPAGASRPHSAASGTPTPATPAMNNSQLAFLKTLTEFYAKRGQTFSGPPAIEGRTIDLARMFAAVQQGGGSAAVNANRRWGHVATSLGFPAPSLDSHPPERLKMLEQAYQWVLLPFEQYWVQIQRARQQASANASNAGSPPAHAMSPTANGVPQAPPSAPSPYAAPSPAAAGTPASGPKQSIQARRIERAASQLAQQKSSQLASPAAPSPYAAGPTAHMPFAAAGSPAPSGPMAPSPYPSANTPVAAAESPAASMLAAQLNAPFSPWTQSRPRTGGSATDSAAGPSTFQVGSVPPQPVKKEEVLDLTMPSPDHAHQRVHSRTPTADVARISSVEPGIKVEPKKLPGAPAPTPRKRRRVEYRPYAKPVEPFGGIEQAHQALTAAERARQSRQIGDLGLIDIYALTMSLRCRIASEVAYALNVLAVIAQHLAADGPPVPGAVPFPLEKCPELFEELFDLLEETAFGAADESRPSNRDDGVGTDAHAPELGLGVSDQSYLSLFRAVEAEKSALVEPPASGVASTARESETDPEEPSNALAPAAITVAVVNLLRGLTITERNMRFATRDPRFAELLIRIANLPIQPVGTPGSRPGRYPIRLSASDSLAVRKVAIEILSHVGLDVHLDALAPPVAADAVRLVLFFLRDAGYHKDAYALHLSSAVSAFGRIVQPHEKMSRQSPTMLPYLAFGLAASARLFLRDGNRSIAAGLLDADELHDTFVDLVALLPIAEKDFQVMTYENGLLYMHSVIVTLYNLAHVAPDPVKHRLRRHPKITRAFLRMVRRLAGTQNVYSDDDIYQQIAQRALAILQMLDGTGERTGGVAGALSKKRATTSADDDVPWYGLPMSGYDDDSDDSLSGAADPSATSALVPDGADEEDGANGPTGAATNGSSKHDVAPILAGDSRQLFEHLAQGMMPLVIPSLIALADGAGTRRKRRR